MSEIESVCFLALTAYSNASFVGSPNRALDLDPWTVTTTTNEDLPYIHIQMTQSNAVAAIIVWRKDAGR